jgi:hypothetical protein
MNVYTVVVRDADGKEREHRLIASTSQSACNQALLRVERETGRKTWMVASCVEVF